MASNTTKKVVKGGVVARSSRTGKFVSVKTPKGTTKASPRTISITKEASARRKSALKRLADR